jgi:DNA polymerase-3 subunit delta
MKVASRDVEAFLDGPSPAISAVLFYGPDAGLVRERADRLVESVAGSRDDPFRVGQLTLAALKEEPSRLCDDVAALSFNGGRRAVRLRDAADAASPAVELLLSTVTNAGIAVLEAGDLGPRSSLRRAIESAGNGAAVPCYRDEGAELQRLIAATLRAAGLQAGRDANAYLMGALGGDRGLTRQELEKLVSYKGAAKGPELRTVSLDDVKNCIGDVSAVSLDDLVFAVADGDLALLESVVDRVLAEGIGPVQLLRGLARHFQRLQLVTAAGRDLDGAMARLRPPVFFQRVTQFKAQARRWPAAAIAEAQRRLVEAEMGCKRTSWPAETLARRTALEIARLPERAKAAANS